VHRLGFQPSAARAPRLVPRHSRFTRVDRRPRYTAVSFSLLLTAAAEGGPGSSERLQQLPRVLELMGQHGVLPRREACDRLVRTCVEAGELQTAQKVLELAPHAKLTLEPRLLQRIQDGLEGRGSKASLPRE
jgi:hypothetical protein